MILKLYRNDSSDNTINKNIILLSTTNINLRGGFNLNDPMIRLKGVDLTGVNYCHIDGLDSFFFVVNIENLGFELYQLELKRDLLETFKNEILTSETTHYRKIKVGDYYEGELETVVDGVVSKVSSDVVIEKAFTAIMVTLGEEKI